MTVGSHRRLTILKSATLVPDDRAGVFAFESVKAWVRSGRILQHLFRYSDVRLLTHRIALLPKPLLTALLIRALSRGRCVIQDEARQTVSVSSRTLARMARQLLRDWRRKAALLDEIDQSVRKLAEPHPSRQWHREAPPVYLRTDLVFGLTSGGSVGHISGVLNSLDSFTKPPVFLSTDRIPTVRADIETHVIEPERAFSDFVQLPGMAFNRTFEREARRLLGPNAPGFLYQRYSTDNFAGVALARHYGSPLVLEYNGSEIWINRNWGRPLPYEPLSERIELLNLNAAEVVVVVSEPMRVELVARGIPGDKILVNPNGVDPDRYAPTVDGTGIRGRYGLAHHLVIGFIGTFGAWHGAEVLADAFVRLLQQHHAYRSSVRLLMIGDGLTLPEARSRIERAGFGAEAIFTGRTLQSEGPAHLAACDILVSPHIPNADGTPFFGSPTKLFEYMAMGKPIVASDLDQIGEVLDHGESAWLVEPGSADALADGIRTLIGDPDLRTRLAAAARQVVVARHTWREHTRRILDKLEERCA